MILALAMLSAIVAFSSAASAQEIHLEGITSFNGTGGASSITAESEPTITCESVEAYFGSISSGGTTGSMSLYFRGCHTTVFGLTAKCKTTFSALSNAIETSGTLHFITVNSTPGILMTPIVTEVICAGISNTIIEGFGVMGTLTSPACGSESTEMTLSFSAVGATQTHRTYTALTELNLKTKTSGGSSRPAGLVSSMTLKSTGSKGELNCT